MDPIARNGGNIISIFHERERRAGDYVPVSLVIDFSSNESFNQAFEGIKRAGIEIIESEQIFEKKNLTCLFVGLDPQNAIKIGINGAEIKAIEAIKPLSNKGCVKIEFSIIPERLEEVLEELRKFAEQSNALLIPSI
ncbi:hypothetical protein B9Q13_05235 [Candidatus Marsarchaeota G2 archaeon ECH_B_SAG-G16]|uniref:ACT domain-containing protein n=1 Tax=Candidatus Marsarchaeota G2 archaeon ECH_B_SAG-G16 TaxID=1978167 RepID=A0A2R6C0B4_9ARCH|nr:MAG: hypothetical protein B9Q13_05235 [Candidatus Marsarchaeota G2 archaeon ECH_B_SAG-G16]